MNPVTEKLPWNYRLRRRLWELGFWPTEPTDTAGGKEAGRSNTLFCLSGLCCFFLYYRGGTADMLAWYAMVAALALLGTVCPGIHRGIRLPIGWKLLAGLSAVGTMGAGLRLSMEWLSAGTGTAQVAAKLGVSPSLLAVGVAGIFAACSLWFLYVLIARCYMALGAVLYHRFRDTGRLERYALVLLAVVLAVYTGVAFGSGTAFYSAQRYYDVIYTADSPLLFMGNTWLNLTFVENDLRQPLFAVFSAPFVGWAYVLTQLVPGDETLRAWLMNLPQILLLVLGYALLSGLLCRRSGLGRTVLTLALCALYPSLLFGVMMEQYLVAVFWLLLFVYMTVEELPGRGGALMGAAGTLLTSAAMLPVMWERKNGKKALWQTVTAMLLGAFLIILFLRLSVVLALGENVERLGSYTGEKVSLSGRVLQYLAFVASCFAPPAAGIDPAVAWPAWRQLPVESVSRTGAVLLVLCLLGAFAGRKEKIVQISAWWSLFSVALLIGLGWGTAENGLVLYSLYFAWAFYILLRRGVVWVLERIGHSEVQTAADMGLALVLLARSVPGIAALLAFTAQYYPV